MNPRLFRTVRRLTHRLFRICRSVVHTGSGYDTGDGCNIEDKAIYFFIDENGNEMFKIVLSVRIETKDNIYIYTPFGHRWIQKKKLDNKHFA